MGQPTPDEFAIPHTAIRSTWKEKTDLVEVLNHSVGAVLLFEQREDRSDGALHFLVGIENDLVAVKYQTNWQWKTQLTFLRSVKFGAMEARANDVQLGCWRPSPRFHIAITQSKTPPRQSGLSPHQSHTRNDRNEGRQTGSNASILENQRQQ